MKILITGINGFVGSNISKFLCNELSCEIIGLEQQDHIVKSETPVYSWDELNKIGKTDYIIHLAGLAKDSANRNLEAEYFRVNTELTKTIYTHFLNSTTNHFIFFSTVKAAGDFSDIPLIEEMIPEPNSIYGKSKFKAEQYILHNLPTDGRKVYILRPCMIHGPNSKGNLVSLYKYIKKGLPYPFGNLSNTRSYISIDNLNFILAKLLSSNVEPGIYHLADDQPLSTTRIVELIGETIPAKPFMMNLPKWMFVKFGQLGTAMHLPINNETIKKLTGNFLVSNEKIKRVLNINKLPLTAEEGMRHTLENIE